MWSALNTVELHAPPIGPIFERQRLEFPPMIHRDQSWSQSFTLGTIEGSADGLPRHPNTGLAYRTLATPVMDDRN